MTLKPLKLKVYPNPANDVLFLATEMNVKEVAIYDIYGRETKVYRFSIS